MARQPATFQLSKMWSTRLAAACFLLVSVYAIWLSNHHTFAKYRWDFIAPYSGARCLLHGCNPYDTAALQREYVSAGGDLAALDARHGWQVLTPVYPPATLLVITPLAWLQYPQAQAVWYSMGAVAFCLGLGMLAWIVPLQCRCLYLFLACCTLFSSNTDLLLRPGNPSAITIGLLALALWSFFAERPAPGDALRATRSSSHRVATGAVLLALALCFKPHLAAPVWAMLLFDKRLRRPALFAGVAAILLLVAGILWMQSTVGPAWLASFRGAATVPYLPGGTSSPLGPEAFRFLNLQTITGLWSQQPARYNAAAYVLTVVLLALWIAALFRSLKYGSWWIALSGLLCLSLLPFYHRDYDSRLLVLTLPAMAILLRTKWRTGLAIALASVPLLFCQTTLHVEHWLGMGGGAAAPVLSRWQTIVLLRQQTVALVLLAVLWSVTLWRKSAWD